MISVALKRLRGRTGRELATRAQATARTWTERVGIAAGGSSWDRRRIVDVLAPHVLDTETRQAVERNEWAIVDARLRRELLDRPSRFWLEPRSAAALRREIGARWPGAAAHAKAAAEPIMAGRHDLLGFRGLSFARDGDGIDWHFDPVHNGTPPRRFWADVPFLDSRHGDHKIIWELNRHQYFLVLGRALWLTGDARYGAQAAAHIQGWLAQNPPLIGVNWASMLELAFRSLSWVTAIHFLLADVRQRANGPLSEPAVAMPQAWLLDACLGLDRQLRHVEHNLSYYFSPNTHLTGEALALYVTGLALPELARSTRWVDIGRSVLLNEAERQILPDGGHVERSTHYHRYTLDFYELALLTAERAGDGDAAAVFRAAVARLADFMTAMADDAGLIPLIGDDDGGMLWPIAGRDPRDVRDSLALAGLLLDRPDAVARWGVPEEAFWLAWSARPAALRQSPDTASTTSTGPELTRGAEPASTAVVTRAFTDTGYVAMRTSRGDHIVFDVGPLGFLNGGHAHADALAITLTLGRTPFLIDPGTATYTMDPEIRDRMRESVSHNTFMLDGRSSSVPSGAFSWATRADAHLAAWRGNPGFGWAEASHDGYRGARCRRSVVSGSCGWLILDEVTGEGSHVLQWHWHFDAAWHVANERPGLVCASHASGRRAWLLHDTGELQLARGDQESGLGWCSPRYGVLTPAWTARVTHAAALPLSAVTWVGEDRLGAPPSVERLPHVCDPHAAAVTVRVRQGAVTTTTMLRPGDDALRDSRRCDAADYHTDARLLQYSVDGNTAMSLSLADARFALALDQHLSVRSESCIADLQVLFRDGHLELWSSAPPVRLHVHGDALRGVRGVRLNGREARAPGSADTTTFLADVADWGDPARVGSGPECSGSLQQRALSAEQV